LIVNQVIGTPTASVNDPVAMGNKTAADASSSDSSDDVYGNQQAPVIVQDETNGVKKYDKSQSTAQVAVNVSSDTSNGQANSSNSATVNSGSQQDQSAQTQSASSQDNTVTVKNGDTLDGIARQLGVSVSDLKQANNLNSDLLVVGQQLKL
jgi:LysM repeat protein